jgi:hypothetical protein
MGKAWVVDKETNSKFKGLKLNSFWILGLGFWIYLGFRV